MIRRLNHLLDVMSNYFAHRKGLIPLLAIVLISLNFILGFFPGLGWLSSSDLLLHLGIILAILGFLLAWAL
ncbi:MAG: hypothetical protein MUC85_10055 [Anaerolineales bacterium]|jgi:hypothetical protein|nr:hypothetical protein [Anaerolineales bacterium]